MSLGNQPSGEDVEILARTVFGEARGESLAGMIAVAFTVLHRARIARGWIEQHGTPHPHFGDGTIKSACLAPDQYSCWNALTTLQRADLGARLDSAEFQISLYVALGVVNRLLSDALPESTHYYNPQKLASFPTWVTGRPAVNGKPAVKAARKLGTIGNHIFCGDVG
jgi:N-acetylmuramoyl-L-alanine amidase